MAADTESISLLQGMPVFGAINEPTLRLLLEGSETRRYSPGEAIIQQGMEARAFYVLESGRVRVQYVHEGVAMELSELGPGDCFGEMALIECAPRSATVLAVDPCVTLRVPLSALTSVMETDLEQFALIQMNLARELSRRLRVADEQLLQLRTTNEELASKPYRWLL